MSAAAIPRAEPAEHAGQPGSFRPPFQLSASEAATIYEVAGALAHIDPLRQLDDYVLEAQVLAAELPKRLRERIVRYRRYSDPLGGLVVRGLPLGPVPPTPSIARRARGVYLPAAYVLSVVAALFGDQIAYRAELGGCVVQDILPQRGRELTQESISSLIELYDHTEQAFNEHAPHHVLLLCLRQDHDRVAETTLSPVADVLAKLPDEVVAELRQKAFKTTVDSSFIRGAGYGSDVCRGPFAVVTGPALRPTVRADFAETSGMTVPATEALEALRAAVTACSIGIRMRPGDFVAVDNRCGAWHGRTAFTPRWDGKDRWLLRTFVTMDLAASIEDRPGDRRIIDTDYRAKPDVLKSDRDPF